MIEIKVKPKAKSKFMNVMDKTDKGIRWYMDMVTTTLLFMLCIVLFPITIIFGGVKNSITKAKARKAIK